MKKIRTIASLLSLFALAACGPNISTVRMGGLFPANPPTCSIKFENMSFQQAMEKYDNIGLITVSGGDIDDKVREQVRLKACKMGADAVTLNAAIDTGSALVGGMTQFMVLHAHAPAPEAAPVAPPTSASGI